MSANGNSTCICCRTASAPASPTSPPASAGWSPGWPAASGRCVRGRGHRRARARPGRGPRPRRHRPPWSTRARSATSPAPPASWPRPTGSTPGSWRCSPSACGRSRACRAARPTPLLVGLVLRRRQLVVLRDAERSRRRRIGEPALLRSLDDHLAWLTAEIAAIEAAIAARLEALAATRQRAALLISVPGIGVLTAASLLALLPELGRLDGKADREPGRCRPVRPRQRADEGRRTIWGGRKAGPHRALHGHPGRHAPQPRRSAPSTTACVPAARPRSSRSPPACASSWSSSTPCSPTAHHGGPRSRLDRSRQSLTPTPTTFNLADLAATAARFGVRALRPAALLQLVET